MTVMRSAFSLLFVSVLGTCLFAQNATPAVASPAATSTAQPAAQSTNPYAQLRDDLNKLDSLNMNMSSEIEFLHDQNLQILLRTNSQMWTLLIRDLRRQVEATEQQRNAAPPAPKH